jgi:hypothetical protein
VLARLEAVEGIADARVEAGGRFFAVTLAEGADEGTALAGAAAALRCAPRRLPPDEAALQLRARAAGDPWLGRAEVASLSFLESRLLASRGAAAVAGAAGLPDAERGALEDAFRDVLFLAMERVLGEGGRDSSGWFYVEWPALAEEIARRAAPALAPERRSLAADALAALHRRG